MFKGGNDDDDGPSRGDEKLGPSKKSRVPDDSSEDDSDDDREESGKQSSASSTQKQDGDYSNLERLRKEKRLAMNRESARNRRKKKKEMMTTLEKRVEDLNNVNKGLRATNESLATRVAQLEAELGAVRAAGSMPTLPGGVGGLSNAGLAADPLLAMQLQGGLGGGLGAGLFGAGGLGGPQAFQLMQMRQQALASGAGAGVDSHILRMARERQELQSRLGASNIGLNPLTVPDDGLAQARINVPRLGLGGEGASGRVGLGRPSVTGATNDQTLSGRPSRQQPATGATIGESKHSESSSRKRPSQDP